MGAYWGSKYLAVIPDELEKCCVEMVDLIPSGNSDQSELIPKTDREDVGKDLLFDELDKAKIAVKSHILLKTSHDICALLCAIESTKHDIEYIRIVEGMNEVNANRIALKEESIEEFKARLSELRKLRRAKVNVN